LAGKIDDRRLSDLRCRDCGVEDVMALAPGTDGPGGGAIDLFGDAFAPRPDLAWCLACWRVAFTVRAA
jgi:hypothetical protein